MNFLRFVSDARTGAMGEAGISIVDNANAVFLNPARLAYVEWHDLSLSYLSWLEGISYGQVAYADNFGKKGTLGLGLSYLSSGDLEGRDESDQAAGNFEVTDMVASLGYGKNIGHGFSLGGAAKFMHEKIKSGSGSGFAGDIGMTYNGKYKKHTVAAAVNLQHFGRETGAGEKSPLPTTLRAGISDRLFEEKIIFCGELVYPFDLDLRINAGTEFIVADFLALRAGYRFMQDDVKGIDALSFGFGLIYPARRVYLLDYAYSTQGDLGAAHRVNVGVRF
ncbi:MAG: PorV/PorQ family protein [Elusimicrobia bacterium]|nr:PorV/PorQ family protein [Elusimicrobiota bacterium]